MKSHNKHLVHLLLIRIFVSCNKNKSVKDSYHLLETDSFIFVRCQSIRLISPRKD
jgi:hypothetical protein